MAVKPPETIGESLYWSYANLAMAHAAISEGKEKYGRIHYMIRARLFKGLTNGTMNIGSILDDEKLKMELPKACCYCGSTENLTMDHLIPKAKGGKDTGDNVVWACKQCNSSKGAKDLLVWFQGKNMFPALFLLRMYLKIAIQYCLENNLMDVPISDADGLPFSIYDVPHKFPPLPELRLY